MLLLDKRFRLVLALLRPKTIIFIQWEFAEGLAVPAIAGLSQLPTTARSLRAPALFVEGGGHPPPS